MSKLIAPKSFYPADDLPIYLEELRQKQTPKPRIARSDLTKGQIVIITNGEYEGTRCIYLSSDNFIATVTGPKSINDIDTLKIDERYLLPTSYIFDLKNVSCSCVEQVLVQKIEKEKYMKRYLKTLFSVPEDMDFYEMKL